MPQAPEYLQAQFNDDGEAFAVIRQNYAVSRGGMVYPKVEGYEGTQAENDAIGYLCMEWDYGYSKEKV